MIGRPGGERTAAFTEGQTACGGAGAAKRGAAGSPAPRRESDQAGAKGLDRGVVLVQAAQLVRRVERMAVHGEHGQAEN